MLRIWMSYEIIDSYLAYTSRFNNSTIAEVMRFFGLEIPSQTKNRLDGIFSFLSAWKVTQPQREKKSVLDREFQEEIDFFLF